MPAPRKIQCTVEGVDAVAAGVFILHLKPDRLIPRFLPGQFCHLALDDYDPSFPWPESRVFSIASNPDDRDRLTLACSVVGSFTKRMQKELTSGARVWAKLPYGDFVISTARPAVLWAGGTGVSAFVAFLVSDAWDDEFVDLVYGVRHASHVVFRGVIEQAASRGMPLHVFVEESVTGTPFSNAIVNQGVIDASGVWRTLRQPARSNHYLSGPPQMLSALRAQLELLGVPHDQIMIDAWA